ncbi:unnamed protein product [Rhodiola kirilowii]
MQDRCLGDMMGTCAAVGCGMEKEEEESCPPSTIPPNMTAECPAKESVGEGIDLFYQARKALTERSPYHVDVSEKDGSQESSLTTLPAALVGLLAKHTDSRRKQNKSHSGVNSKKKSTSKQNRGSHFWTKNEVYFKELTLSDIDTLFMLSKFLTSDCMKYLSIPAIGDACVTNGAPSVNAVSAASPSCAKETSISGDVAAATARSGEEVVSIRDPSDNLAAPSKCGDGMVSTGVFCVATSGRSGDERVSCDSVAATSRSGDEIDSVGVPSDNVVPTAGSGDEMVIDDEKVIKTDMKVEVKQENGNDACSREEKCSSPFSSPRSSVSVEWVLGSKNKILLASERPSKKRKLLGENAGLEKLIVSQPCEGNPNLCHVCSKGDSKSEPSNRLIVCGSCGVAVHIKCYGIDEGDIVESSWLCSWCKHTSNSEEVSGRDMSSDSKPCLLCPKQGGALKPLKSNEAGPVKFAHLFCSQWMPEVFVEDTKLMEPIMIVDGINETRKKLKCSICKVKYGACVRCSNGTCRASFHPICAREASNRTEIWGKAGNSDVELRAFCSKHSVIPSGNEDIHVVDPPTTIGGETSQATTSSEALPNGHIEQEFGSNICDIQLDVPGNLRKLQGELVDQDMPNGGIVVNLEPENCCSEPGLDEEALQINHIDGVKPSVAFLLKMLIGRGKVNMEEMALEMSMPPDSLAAALASGNLTPVLQNKAIGWLKSQAYLRSLQRNIQVKIKPMDKLDKEALLSQTQVNNYALELNGCTNESSHDSIEKDLQYPASISSTMAPHVNGIGFNTSAVTEQENPSLPIDGTVISEPWFAKECRPSYIHMSVHGKLLQMKRDIPFSEADNQLDDCRLKQVAGVDLSPSDCIFPNLDTKNSAYNDTFSNNGHELEQLSKAKALRIFDIAPEDELEGELVYFQHRLLETKLKRKRISDGLVSKAVKSLPSQIDIVRSQIWDSLFVSKYRAEVQEAKKQGKKEKKHRENQAVLAAATAAAASSSRISTLRKDDLDVSSSHENPSKASHMLRPSTQSQLMPRPKEMVSRVAVPKVTFDKQCDFFQSSSELNKENARSCDVCRRPETILNSILVCSICKVAVHLDCYRSETDFTGPWQCELCEDTASQISQPAIQNPWEKPIPSAECVVCGGGTVGAFRKSADGQWIHAFCAEWTLQSTFRRGQTDPVEGLESISKGNDACCVCRLKKGVCLKCHYGHCQSTFHPSCARSAGFYMNIKSDNKVQHKAYCEKHSSEQRSKQDENQKHGADELKSVKQVRVELERLRLLCERIVKREKIKRDLVVCSHDILASKRDSVAFSVSLHSPYFHPSISSDSATTSLYNSGSEAIQKSDDMTVDSISSVKKPLNLAGSLENDRKTDDSSTSQLVFFRKNTQRKHCAGKKIPNRTLSISRNLSDDSADRLKIRKPPETFDKELVMTSDQICMKKQDYRRRGVPAG